MLPNAISIQLSDDEFDALMEQDPGLRNEGAFQSLLVTLQDNTDPHTKILVLPVHLIERINRCAFESGQPEWEKTLRRIFSRTLGESLDRIPA